MQIVNQIRDLYDQFRRQNITLETERAQKESNFFTTKIMTNIQTQRSLVSASQNSKRQVSSKMARGSSGLSNPYEGEPFEEYSGSSNTEKRLSDRLAYENQLNIHHVST